MDPLIIILFIIILALSIAIAYWLGKRKGTAEIDERVEDALKRQRPIIGGQFSEQLAPYLPDFKYSPTECRFVGKPIDLIAFPGMDEKEISEVVFVEVKSGKAQLSTQERKLREAIKDKKVRWEEYRVPEGVTEKRGEKN